MKLFNFIYTDLRRGKVLSEKIAAPSKVQALKLFLSGAVLKNITIEQIIRIC